MGSVKKNNRPYREDARSTVKNKMQSPAAMIMKVKLADAN